jgi:hypothetical protein
MRAFACRSIIIFVVLVGLACATPTFADSFGWEYIGQGVTASGTLTATPLSNGVYLITGMTGTRNGQAITFLPYPPSSFGGNNNLLYQQNGAAGPFLDEYGVTFAVGGIQYNIYYWAGQYYEWGSNSSIIPVVFTDPPVDPSSTQTPEPSSLALFGSGVIGLGALLRRKFLCR